MKCKDTGSTGIDGWAPKDFKSRLNEILELSCCFYELVESFGVWPIGLTHAALPLNPVYGTKSGGLLYAVAVPKGAVGDPASRLVQRHKRGDNVKSRILTQEVSCDVHAGTLGLKVVRLISSVATTRGVESFGVWPIGLTHAAVTLIPKNEVTIR